MILKNCPLCDTPLSEEKFNKVTGIWKTKEKAEAEFKAKREELEKKQKEAEQRIKEKEKKLIKAQEDMKKKLQQQANDLDKKWKEKEQEILKKAEEKAEQRSEKKWKKRIEEETKKALKLGKEIHQKKIDIVMENLSKALKEKDILEKKYREALKKGKTIQEMGFDYERELIEELETKFKQDKLIKKGQQGDILHVVLHKDREISKILYECKRVNEWKDIFERTLKNAMESRGVEFGIIITTKLKKGKKGFHSLGEKVFAINPEGVIDFVKFLRNQIVEIYSSKLTKEERDVIMRHLWEYVEGNKFNNSINGVIDRAKYLKSMLEKEEEIHNRIWKQREKCYDDINENSSNIKLEIDDIRKSKKKIPISIKEKIKKKETEEDEDN